MTRPEPAHIQAAIQLCQNQPSDSTADALLRLLAPFRLESIQVRRMIDDVLDLKGYFRSCLA